MLGLTGPLVIVERSHWGAIGLSTASVPPYVGLLSIAILNVYHEYLTPEPESKLSNPPSCPALLNELWSERSRVPCMLNIEFSGETCFRAWGLVNLR